MPCTCIEEMNVKLVDYNTKLCLTFGWTKDGNTFTRPHIETEKIEKRMRKGPAVAVATFCPFCGERYEAQPAAPKLEGGAE
jgi:hypothetical protein